MTKKQTEIDVKRGEPGGTPAQRSNPFSSLRHEIDRLFDEFDWPGFHLPLRGPLARSEASRPWLAGWSGTPVMDLVEHSGDYELQAELPGLDMDDIEIKISNGLMTIRGEKSEQHSKEEDNYHLHERSYGQFQRSFSLPQGIDTDKIEAKYDKGVLYVQMPKSAEAIDKERKIEVRAA